MKKLTLVAILMVAAVLSFGIDTARAQTWGSYSSTDYANDPSDSFTDLHCTVYMYGEGFEKKVEHKIVYWDGEDNSSLILVLSL